MCSAIHIVSRPSTLCEDEWVICHILSCCCGAQALKANPSLAPKEVKIGSNYITKFGQVALMEALDMVYEMGDHREIVIHF